MDNCLQKTDKSIQSLYALLSDINPPSTAGIKSSWEDELGQNISDQVWGASLRYIHTCSINSRHCLIQFKILHRLHYSKTRLHKLFSDSSPLCDKCYITEATLLHSYALCPRLRSFWAGVFTTCTAVLKFRIDPDPVLTVLGVSEASLTWTRAQQNFVAYALIIAKKLILLYWKKKEAPNTKLWLSELTNTLHMEQIRYRIEGKIAEFDQIWSPFTHYLSSSETWANPCV